MRQAAMRWAIVIGAFAAGVATLGQTPPRDVTPNSSAGSQPNSVAQSTSGQAVTGGRLHGVVKSGNIPLPGVTVTAQNTLTGKRYSTTTDITGTWALTIPQNGRYVIRTELAAFAQGSQEALLNASNHDQAVNFELMLASRAAQQEQQQNAQAAQVAQAIRQVAGNGAQSLS